MAISDYHLCAACGRKAFYDACLNYDYDDDEGRITLDSVGHDSNGDLTMTALCESCAETYEITILPRSESASRALGCLRATADRLDFPVDFLKDLHSRSEALDFDDADRFYLQSAITLFETLDQEVSTHLNTGGWERIRDMLPDTHARGVTDWPSAVDALKRLSGDWSRLVAAAGDALLRWDSPQWKDIEPTAVVMNRLRKELQRQPPKHIDTTETGEAE